MQQGIIWTKNGISSVLVTEIPPLHYAFNIICAHHLLMTQYYNDLDTLDAEILVLVIFWFM